MPQIPRSSPGPSTPSGTEAVSYTHLDVYKRQAQPAEGGGREDGLLRVMDQSVGRVPPEIVGPDEEDVAADPEHRHRADDGQGAEDPRHRPDQPRPDRPRQARASLGQGQPDVCLLYTSRCV